MHRIRYDVRDAPNRRVKRLIEKDNKKVCGRVQSREGLCHIHPKSPVLPLFPYM